MLSFKEQLKADLNKVIFNPLEFSETHAFFDEQKGTVKQVRMIIDSLELIEREQSKKSQYQAGLYNEQTLLYIPTEDLGSKPKIGKIIKVDNKRYTVTDVAEENGLYSITVEAVKS